MSFNPDQLVVLSSVNGFTNWFYRTMDSIHEMTTGEYFKGAAVRAGDKITISFPRTAEDAHKRNPAYAIADLCVSQVFMGCPLLSFPRQTAEEEWMEPA